MSIKKNQHYVWRHYLKPWSIDSKICCKRNDDVFNTSLKNVAVEKLFYESVQLKEEEENFVLNIMKNLEPSLQGPLLELFNFYKWTTKFEITRKNGIEEFHTNLEKKGIKFLNNLYLENTLFLNNQNHKRDFCNYIGAQYTRTRKMRENLTLGGILSNYSLDMNRLSNIMHLIFIVVIGNWLFSRGKIEFLKVCGDLNLITADQPIINTKGTIDLNETPEEFELYYPLTPKLALYLSEENEGIRHLNNIEIKEFNSLIKTHHYKQLFALGVGDI